MRVSVVQMNPGHDKAKNIAAAERLTEAAIAADRPDFVALPEMWTCLGGDAAAKRAAAERLPGTGGSNEPGPAYTFLRDLAVKHRIVVHGGWARQVNVMKERHVKVILCGPAGETEAIMWNAIGTPLGDALAESEDRWVDVYGTAKVDEYGGRRRATLMVEDAILGASLASAAA